MSDCRRECMAQEINSCPQWDGGGNPMTMIPTGVENEHLLGGISDALRDGDARRLARLFSFVVAS